MKELIIDPRFSYYYASFYLYGLNQVYGNCKFKKKCFIDLPFEELAHSNDRLLCYMVKDNSGRARKIVIDYRDQTSIIDSFYDWADVYAKINVNETETIVPDKSKLRLIAPGFGIRYYNLSQTLWNALSNLLVIKKGHFGINVNAKDFLRDYLLTWYRRRPYKEYHLNSIKERDNYVFFVSTLWRHQNCIEHTNPLRALFMRTCKKLGIDFEGGFYISQSGNSSATDGYNVPSCLNCHGWKLGEFLAMGKSIISAPLYNELPGDGKQIMLSVDSEEELEDAIVLLTKDTEKRKIFEANALTYYKKYVSPEAVIQYLDKQ